MASSMDNGNSSRRALKGGKSGGIFGNFTFIGIGAGVLFWFLESAMHAFLFREGTFIQQAIAPRPNELWMRSLIVLLLAGAGFYVHWTLKRIEEYESGRVSSRSANIRRYTIGTVILWTLVIGISLTWNILQQYDNAKKGVSVPVEPYMAIAGAYTVSLILGHGLMWLIGVTGISYGSRQFGREFTRRKHAEEELLRYASIVSSSSDMMAFLDADFIYLAANKAYLAAFGMTKDQVVGHTVSQVYGEEFFETTIKPKAEHCLEGNEVHYEDWFQFPVHGLRFMAISYSPFAGPEGEIKGFIVNAHDITEHRQAEDGLRREALLNKTLLDSFPCSVLLLRPDTREIVAANQQAIDTGAVIGKTCHLTWGGNEDICPWCLAPKLWDSGKHQNVEVEVLGKTFDTYWTPVSDDLYVHYAFDITERKEAEEKEKQQHAKLAHASRVNSIGEMASSLAHEINQPLFVMQAQAERSSKLLESGSQNIDTVIDKMQIIMKQADRAEKIISRIREFVRKGKSKKQKISLNALINDSLELLRNEIAHKNIKLHLDLSTDTPEVNTDPVQIEQVIVNLINNSIDALDESLENERQISIKSSVTGGNAEVRIKDNGSGMSPKEIQIAFDSFYTTKSYGLGIGLSISRTIIESQGGRIGLEANADKGVTSYFTLPVNKAD